MEAAGAPAALLLAAPVLKPLRWYQDRILSVVQRLYVAANSGEERPRFRPAPQVACAAAGEGTGLLSFSSSPSDLRALLSSAPPTGLPPKPVTSALLYLPTGGGKTRVAGEVAAWVMRSGGRVLFIVNRVRLVEQTASAFRELGLGRHIGYVAAGYRPDPSKACQIAMILSLCARANRAEESATAAEKVGEVEAEGREEEGDGGFPHADLVIVDEAHAAGADTYARVLAHYRGVRGSGGEGPLVHRHPFILGLTATPVRLSPGRSLAAVFEVLLQGPSVTALVTRGVLVPPVTIAAGSAELRAAVASATSQIKRTGPPPPVEEEEAEAEERISVKTDESALAAAWAAPGALDGVVEAWKTRAAGRRTVAFATTVAQAKAIAATFEEAGIPAAAVDGTTSLSVRDAVYARLKAGAVLVLSSVGVIAEGFDEPQVAAVLLLRPTASRGLYVQQVGRGLRASPDKRDCIVLDFAGCALAHGPVTRPFETDLEGGEGRGREGGRAWVCRMETCRAVMHGSAAVCALCGCTRRDAGSSGLKQAPTAAAAQTVSHAPSGVRIPTIRSTAPQPQPATTAVVAAAPVVRPPGFGLAIPKKVVVQAAPALEVRGGIIPKSAQASGAGAGQPAISTATRVSRPASAGASTAEGGLTAALAALSLRPPSAPNGSRAVHLRFE